MLQFHTAAAGSVTSMDFTGRQARSLARLSAYTLLAVFLISLLVAVVPLPLDSPQRSVLLLNEVLERSFLVVIALVCLYFGLADEALPARWEVCVAGWLRPLLRLASVLYLLTAIAVVALAVRIEDRGVGQLGRQVDSTVAELQRLRVEVEQAADPADLLRSLSRDPRLIQAMRSRGRPAGETGTLEEQQDLALELIDRAEANLRRRGLERRADASGNLTRQTLRLTLMALAYGLFHLLAGFIWPRSLAATRARLADHRAALAADEPAP